MAGMDVDPVPGRVPGGGGAGPRAHPGGQSVPEAELRECRNKAGALVEAVAMAEAMAAARGTDRQRGTA